MGKRSDFKRKERDFYPTPYEAVVPLLPHLSGRSVAGMPIFHEPCAGDGDLRDHLEANGCFCVAATDINGCACMADPPWNGECVNGCKGASENIIILEDALEISHCAGDMFITNPPYDWKILNPLINHLSDIAPTWLLLPADMMHNKRMAPHMDRCDRIVSVGRVKWFGNQTGMENSAWMLFDSNFTDDTLFFGR